MVASIESPSIKFHHTAVLLGFRRSQSSRCGPQEKFSQPLRMSPLIGMMRS
jgi:hypothetical protein